MQDSSENREVDYQNRQEDANDETLQEGEQESEDSDSQIPLLFVDVNLGKGVMKRIILYEGDDPNYIAEMFAKDNNLEGNMRSKLERLLKKQMDGVLSKIEEGDEDEDSNS